MDTQMQNFWIESINKEASLRFQWQLKYSKSFARAVAKRQADSQPTTSMSSNIARHIERMENELKNDYPKPAGEASRSRGITAEKGTVKEEDLKLDDVEGDDITDRALATFRFRDMRPASPQTRSELYKGISHHEEGRYAYLKKRNNKSPEEKYEFPILSSCVYGWKIGNNDMTKSPYARTRIIRDTFYRRSGIITG